MFWCLDAVFRRLKGVKASVCGYVGGNEKDANYYRVASGNTGHAESVQVTFDESILPARDLLDIFFLIHDPTTKDRQNNDVGPQYRSAMFYSNENKRMNLKQQIERAEALGNLIVTELTNLKHSTRPNQNTKII